VAKKVLKTKNNQCLAENKRYLSVHPQIQQYMSEREIEKLFDKVNALAECDRLIDGVIAV